MTRLLPLLTAALLLATPALAGGISFDLPDLTYPSPKAAVTQSTAGTKVAVTAPSQD